MGGVASRFNVTVFDAVPPKEVTVQERLTPAVSSTMVLSTQSVMELMADSGSVRVQETATSEVYQSPLPWVPETVAVITGGVVSATTGEALRMPVAPKTTSIPEPAAYSMLMLVSSFDGSGVNRSP